MAIVEFERRGPVAIVTLNRPKNRNAIDAEMARAIGDAWDAVEADAEIRVGILAATTTEQRPVFCSGHDLRTIVSERDGGDRAETVKGGFAGLTTYPRTKPLIAAVDGLATSGGLELVLSCDLVVATERSSFALAEVKWNLIAGAGGLFRLPWAIGRSAAMDMILSGEEMPAERAYQLGLVSTLVKTDALQAALDRAEVIASNGALAVSISRGVADRAFELSGPELWSANERGGMQILHSAELEAGLGAWAT